MNRASAWMIALLLAAPLAMSGCLSRNPNRFVASDTDMQYYQSQALQIEYPDVDTAANSDVLATQAPLTLSDKMPTEFWDLTVEQTVQIALQNSSVLRDLGALVLTAPENVRTMQGPAITETDPRFGVDAALSAFDAAWTTHAFFEKNDRALNNQFFGGGTRQLQQDLFDYSSELSKTTATGGRFMARHNVLYDFNNAPGNDNPNKPWTTNFELEARQPLLQGAGAEFNRIAGPNAIPGLSNGVLLSRINTDVSLADFEMGVRNLVFDVETAYWELYFAYRDLDAKIAARDRALETWRTVNSLGGRESADKEAHAREQYYRLEEEVQNALSGNRQERSRVTTLRGAAGVYENERRLRLMIGVPISDGRLIRPSEEPLMAKVVFNWDEVLSEALTRRSELRRQKWRIKHRELEVVAARNFLYPRLDAVGRYRWRGLGQRFVEPNGNNRPRFDDALGDVFTGDFQEWQLGFELSFPIGFRQAHAAVRNAQLMLSREYAVLQEQEREITHDLMNALGDMERAYVSARLNYNRRLAAREQLDALVAQALGRDRRDETRLLDLILDAQRRLADAESRYFRSLSEYMLAIKTVHYNKGSLLEYNDVYMAESPWPRKAYEDEMERERLRLRPWRLTNFIVNNPPLVSQGPAPASIGTTGSAIDFNPNPSGFDRLPAAETIEPSAESGEIFELPAVDAPSPPVARTEPSPQAAPIVAGNQSVVGGGSFDPAVRPTGWQSPRWGSTAPINAAQFQVEPPPPPGFGGPTLPLPLLRTDSPDPRGPAPGPHFPDRNPNPSGFDYQPAAVRPDADPLP